MAFSPHEASKTRPISRGEPLPVGLFSLQIFAPRRSQRIELRPAIVVGLTPLGLDPSALLQAMERRIDRSLVHLEYLSRHPGIRWAMPQPCMGSRAMVLRIRRSNVPSA